MGGYQDIYWIWKWIIGSKSISRHICLERRGHSGFSDIALFALMLGYLAI
jgi:hypothetical protein